MHQEVTVIHRSDMSFDSAIEEHSITLDAKEEFGGKHYGPTPKPMLLVSLGGCTGMDVVSLLQKMRQEYTSFKVRVEGEQTDEHPKYYHKIHVTYLLQGDNLDESKVKKAVDLSQDKYCGVSYMLKQACNLTYSIEISA